MKASAKKLKYRHYKEIYEIDLDLLKEIIENCTMISYQIQKYFESKKTEANKKINRMKTKKYKYFLFIDKSDYELKNTIKGNSKKTIKEKSKKNSKKATKGNSKKKIKKKRKII